MVELEGVHGYIEVNSKGCGVRGLFCGQNFSANIPILHEKQPTAGEKL